MVTINPCVVVTLDVDGVTVTVGVAKEVTVKGTPGVEEYEIRYCEIEPEKAVPCIVVLWAEPFVATPSNRRLYGPEAVPVTVRL
jgi:hypothetical protein